jgi:hypothetical protein
MMKTLITTVFLFSVTISFAQTPEEAVKSTVNSFFEAFHARDAEGMQKWIHEDALLRRTAPNENGIQTLRDQDFQDLINGIVAMPDATIFEEKLLSYSIQVDGPLAHVWTPYAFYLDNRLHHAGANSIQLFEQKGMWKIIYLIDSRTSEGAKE